jgi:hypothetical protein
MPAHKAMPQYSIAAKHTGLSLSCYLSHAAFDKDDLLYLRDKEQEQRFQEQYKRDAEAAAFAAARAQAEQQLERQAVAKLRQQDMTLHDGVRYAVMCCQQLPLPSGHITTAKQQQDL